MNRLRHIADRRPIVMSGIAAAQNFPSKPIRVVVPFAAGSGTDILARIVTEEMRTAMGANFVIDNRAGASGQIACRTRREGEPGWLYAVALDQYAAFG